MNPGLVRRWAPVALCACLAIPAAAADVKWDPSSITFPPLHVIRPVQPLRYVMPNGAVVYLLEDHSLPVVSGTAYFPSSASWVPADRVGMGSLTGEVMRSGGTAAHTGDWLDDRLGAIAASVNTSVGGDNSEASFRCLSENTAELVGLFADVLRRPAFPEEKIELSKVGFRRAIAERNDEVIPILLRVARETVYGKDSPYARSPEYATIEPITRADCVKMHARIFVPNRMILAVYGDFRTADMKALLSKAFGDWPKNSEAMPPLPAPPALGARRTVFAPKEDVSQSGILLVHPGFRASEPDLPDMDVLETLLGAGFQSRLFNRIRTQRGLAYAAGAGAGSGFIRPGIFIAYSLTQAESTLTALGLVQEEVERITREPATDAEVRQARETVLNNFVFKFEDPSEVLDRAAYYELAGYPANFLQTYQKGVESVTPASMLAAAKRHIHPENLAAVMVGNEKQWEKPLESLGAPVTRVDISIPPPPSKVKVGAATPEAAAEGAAWLRKAADLAGGSAAWAAVKSMTVEQNASVSMMGQNIDLVISSTWVLPDKRLSSQKGPFGEVLQGFDGKSGWLKSPQGVQEMPDMAAAARAELERSLLHVFGHPEALELQALAEPRTVDGIAYRVAAVRSDAVHDWLMFFAPDGRLARMEYQGRSPQGPASQTAIYGDWRAVDGLQYPYSSKILMDGKPYLDGKISSVKLNPPIGEDAFRKPAE